ncbi:MAG: hypothetical protein KDA44_11550 [Planctomycetales bacterium]|nr:hypothetical protein [Planctomycetales bacterium]
MGVRFSAAVTAVVLLAAASGCSALRGGDCCDEGCRDGRSFAGMKYDACCEHCGGGCGKSGCCDDQCAGSCDDCNDACCDAACDACGAGDCGRCAGDGCGCSCQKKGGWFSRVCRKCGIGCAGCGEFYWCEWENDPPACCEPCNCHGDYIGPGDPGYYRAPYAVPDLAP